LIIAITCGPEDKERCNITTYINTMNDRRVFLKQLLGCGASIIVAPIAKVLPKQLVVRHSPKIILPIIRRTFPELLTHEIVDVQPMSGPVGLAFHMNYVYTPKKWSIEWWKKLFKHTGNKLKNH
jgi:hypothetical protein